MKVWAEPFQSGEVGRTKTKAEMNSGKSRQGTRARAENGCGGREVEMFGEAGQGGGEIPAPSVHSSVHSFKPQVPLGG